jgi:Putative auto-transporter adhesin, head GIN domain
MRNTVVVLAGAVVLHLGASRLYADDDRMVGMEQTPPPAQLATLRDFSTIEVEGDFSLDVVQGADYSVAFTPSAASEGRFYATVRGDTLLLGGFRNAPGSVVRVALPELKKLNAGRVKTLSVSGFDGASLSLEVDTISKVTLRNNSVRTWQIRSNGVADLQIDRASIGAGKVDLTGRAVLTVIE